MNEYPPDEFDEISYTGPAGAHMAVRPRWKTLLPFLVVVVVAPLLAWGVVWAIKDTGINVIGTKSVTSTAKPATTAPTDTVTSTVVQPTQAPVTGGGSETPKAVDPVVPVNKASLKVQVLNVSAGKGAAGRVAKKLQEIGVPKATAANGKNDALTVSTVYYGKKELKATAEEIAKSAGITNIQLSQQSVENDDIRVYLVKDFKG